MRKFLKTYWMQILASVLTASIMSSYYIGKWHGYELAMNNVMYRMEHGEWPNTQTGDSG